MSLFSKLDCIARWFLFCGFRRDEVGVFSFFSRSRLVVFIRYVKGFLWVGYKGFEEKYKKVYEVWRLI